MRINLKRIDKDFNLVAIDFGCIKQIPDEFYIPYFELADLKVIANPKLFQEKLYELTAQATQIYEQIKQKLPNTKLFLNLA